MKKKVEGKANLPSSSAPSSPSSHPQSKIQSDKGEMEIFRKKILELLKDPKKIEQAALIIEEILKKDRF